VSASNAVSVAGLLKDSSFLFSHGGTGHCSGPKRKWENKEAFKINFYEPLGMSFNEFTKEKFAPATRGVEIDLPGYPFRSRERRPARRTRRRIRERWKSRFCQRTCISLSRQSVSLFLKPNVSVCNCRLLRLPNFDRPCHCSWKCKASGSTRRRMPRVKSAQISGPRWPQNKRRDGQERIKMPASSLHILRDFWNLGIYLVRT
jgi:hypothetical protein